MVNVLSNIYNFFIYYWWKMKTWKLIFFLNIFKIIRKNWKFKKNENSKIWLSSNLNIAKQKNLKKTNLKPLVHRAIFFNSFFFSFKLNIFFSLY